VKDPWKKLLSNVKVSGRIWHTHKNKPKRIVAISNLDLRRQFEAQRGLCYWFDVPLNPMDVFVAGNPLSPSVDRLDNSKGYEPDNIVICCRMANLGKGTCDDFAFLAAVAKIKNAWTSSLDRTRTCTPCGTAT
jgi:hypothetical protein